MTGCPRRDGVQPDPPMAMLVPPAIPMQSSMIPAFAPPLPLLFPETVWCALVMIPSRRTPRPCPWLTCALGRCARAAFPAEGGENWSPPSPRSGAPVGTRETWRMHPCGRLAHLPTAGRPGFQARPPWLHQPSIARVRQVSSRAVLILADGAGTKGAAVHLLVPWFPHALVRSSPPVPARERKKKKKRTFCSPTPPFFPIVR